MEPTLSYTLRPKYLGGHNDVLAGAIMTNDAAIYDKLFLQPQYNWPVLSPFDSYLLLRGLKTLALRMERSTQNAQEVVAFLKKSPCGQRGSLSR